MVVEEEEEGVSVGAACCGTRADPAAAALFVVPLMPYVSNAAGECMGDTHEKRMSRAAG